MSGSTSAPGLVNLPLATVSDPAAPVQQQDLESAPIFALLPKEVLEGVMQYIPLKDIVAFRSTCKEAMSKIQYIPHRGSEQFYTIQEIASRQKIFKQIRTLHTLKTLGIRPDIARLIKTWLDKGIPVAQADVAPHEDSYIYARRGRFSVEEGYGTILVGKSNQTYRPFVNMVFHTAYTLFTPELFAAEQFHKMQGYRCGAFSLTNRLSCTLFQRYSDHSFYCITTSDSLARGHKWYVHKRNTEVPSTGELQRPVIEAVMSDAHKGLHRAYPIAFSIREVVQESMLKTCCSSDEVSKQLACATFTAAQIIADYAVDFSQGYKIRQAVFAILMDTTPVPRVLAELITEYCGDYDIFDPRDKCRRCEVQESMNLALRVHRDGNNIAEYVMQCIWLRGVLDIYQLIDEYAGHA